MMMSLLFLSPFLLSMQGSSEQWTELQQSRKSRNLAISQSNSPDFLRGIAVDSSDNIFACGEVDNFSGLLKYNSQGELLWKKTFSEEVRPCSNLVLDMNNTVYLSFCKEFGQVICEVYLIATDSNGNRLFETTVRGNNDDDDVPTDLIIDYPNIFITGYTYNRVYLGQTSIGRPDGFISKFNAVNGSHITTLRFGSTSTTLNSHQRHGGHTVPTALTIDSFKNIFITGSATGNFMSQMNQGKKDVLLMKVNEELTTISYGRLYGTDQNDIAEDIIISTDNFIYLTGSTQGSFSGFEGINSGQKDVLFSKINPSDGSVVFHRVFGTSSNDVGYSLVCKSSTKQIFIAGKTGGNLNGVISFGHDDAFVVEYNDFGERKQTRLIGTADYDGAYGLAIQEKTDSLLIGGYNSSKLVTDGVDSWSWHEGGQIMIEKILLSDPAKTRERMRKSIKSQVKKSFSVQRN